MARIAGLLFDNGHLLAMALAVIAVAGLSSLISLPRIEDPRITNRNPIVLTFVPGASAERVEALVTEKLEERLDEVPEIKELDSASRLGLSVISIELGDAVTTESSHAVLSDIRDKLADARPDLPPEALDPVFDDKRGAVAFSKIYALSADIGGTDETAQLGLLTRLAKDLADRIRNVPGTEIARLYGESEEEITVRLDHAELAALGLTPAAVSAQLRDADSKVPAGLLRGAQRDLALEVTGQLDSLERIRRIPLAAGESASMVRLGDVARVERGRRSPPEEIGLVEGRRSVFVAARMQPAEHADRWSASIDEAVEEYRWVMGEGLSLVEVFDQSVYTSERLSQLGGNLAAGVAIVIAVVLLISGWRASLLVGLALPLSASLALFGLALLGGTLQQMSIFGMIIALGLLIDNAIVVVDDVGKLRTAGRSPRRAVTEAISHLAGPLLASTATTVLAFMPILLLRGNVGDFVGSIGTSVILALLASFFVALTLVAALAGRFGGAPRRDARRVWWRDGLTLPRTVTWMSEGLRSLLSRPWRAVGVAALPALIGFALAPTLGSQFFPRVDRNMIDVRVWMPREASVARTREQIDRMGAAIARHDGVQSVAWLAGGSFPSVYYNLVMREDATPHFAQGVVTTHSFEDVKRLLPMLQRELDDSFPGSQVVVRRFAQGPPVEAEVELTLTGPSVTVLKELGEQVRSVLVAHPDVLHTRVSMEPGQVKLWLDADEEEARLAGLTLRDVAAQLEGNLEGRTGGSVLESREELPVRVRLDDARRGDLGRIASTQLVATGAREQSRWVPLDALGELALRPSLANLTRCDGVRCNEVLGFVREGGLAIEVTREVQARLSEAGFVLPAGYHLSAGGDAEEENAAVSQLLAYAPVLGMLTIATLVLAFRSFALAGVLVAVAGVSVGFGLLATWLSGFPLSFNSLLGIAGLIGVALNDSIVVLAAIRGDARARTGDVDAIVARVQASGRHVTSTTLTTIGGFLPLLVLTGGDFWPPLAIVIAGGVAGATLLAVLFTPGLYVLIARIRRGAAERAPSGTGDREELSLAAARAMAA